jgi:hypothetical protein
MLRRLREPIALDALAVAEPIEDVWKALTVGLDAS